MSRGKTIMLERDCEYCAESLPELRHPKSRYCNPICRQRDRYQRNNKVDGIKCLDCGKVFARVGSHVVQVHGYDSVLEYRKEHGLMHHETRLENHAEIMRVKASTHKNLKHGKPYQYRKGGNNGKELIEFWDNRKKKAQYKKLNSNLRGNIKL